ncbi:MAG: hypothetical protein LUF35_13190 [Lachnospiraceae bacterium]|nr:hypothetical protein [Lachnospiraceae bacterium]
MGRRRHQQRLENKVSEVLQKAAIALPKVEFQRGNGRHGMADNRELRQRTVGMADNRELRHGGMTWVDNRELRQGRMGAGIWNVWQKSKSLPAADLS